MLLVLQHDPAGKKSKVHRNAEGGIMRNILGNRGQGHLHFLFRLVLEGIFGNALEGSIHIDVLLG